MKKNIISILKGFGWGLVICLIISLCSCKTIKYVPVETERIVEHIINHTDTIKQIDSIYTSVTSMFTEIDSATLADEYGIKIASQQKAFLLKTKELESRLHDALQQSNHNEIAHDTIRSEVPVPVEVEVNKVTWFQRLQMLLGDFLLGFLLIALIIYICKRKGFFL